MDNHESQREKNLQRMPENNFVGSNTDRAEMPMVRLSNFQYGRSGKTIDIH